MLSILVVCSYALQSTTIPLEIKEPLELLNYPSQLSVFPGQTINFTVTIRNSAPVTYNITLDFSLNDTKYQTTYTKFSNSIYVVAPGETDLPVSVEISSFAPATYLTLTVSPNRSKESPTQAASTVSPTMTLFGGGARWAAGQGTSVLYINWFDNYNTHYYTDGANWGPWWQKIDLENMKKNTINELVHQGFSVECAADVPNDIIKYDLVIFEAWFAVEPKHNQLVRDYLNNGGNVIIMAGVPCYFSVYCKDMWPYRFGGMNLSSLQDWFGGSSFANTGGTARIVADNPFDTTLSTKDYLMSGVGSSCYSIVKSSLDSNSHVIALWEDGSVFAFTHEYGKGRIYYQAAA